MMLVVAWGAKRVLFPGRGFDAAAWALDADYGRGPRLEMADRLVARSALLGRTRAEVVAQLGEPPPTAYFSDWDLVYWLGPERGLLSIDSEWLVVRFSSAGTASDCRIVRD